MKFFQAVTSAEKIIHSIQSHESQAVTVCIFLYVHHVHGYIAYAAAAAHHHHDHGRTIHKRTKQAKILYSVNNSVFKTI